MKRKQVIALFMAVILTLCLASSAFAASQTFTIPYLDYFVQHGMSKGDTSTFVYTNTTGVNQTIVFRITNVNYNDNSTTDVVGKLSGSYLLRYANGTTYNLGTIGGSVMSGGLTNYLAPGASFVVNLKPADGVNQVAFKIKFDAH